MCVTMDPSDCSGGNEVSGQCVARAGHPNTGRIELERFVPYQLAVLADAVSRCLAPIYMGRFNLTIPEWRVLAALGDQAPLSATEIGERTTMGKVQVSRAVASLLAVNMLVRQTATHDRRCSQLRLSREGARVYRQIVPLARAREEALLSALSAEDRAALDRIIHALLAKSHSVCDESDSVPRRRRG
jgi:DNA-binding MarR family transcriptional regulator